MERKAAIITTNGVRMVNAQVFGQLAMHNAIPDQEDVFTVTYLPSGHLLANFRDPATAASAARYLAPHFDAVPQFNTAEYKVWLSGIKPILERVISPAFSCYD